MWDLPTLVRLNKEAEERLLEEDDCPETEKNIPEVIENDSK